MHDIGNPPESRGRTGLRPATIEDYREFYHSDPETEFRGFVYEYHGVAIGLGCIQAEDVMLNGTQIGVSGHIVLSVLDPMPISVPKITLFKAIREGLCLLAAYSHTGTVFCCRDKSIKSSQNLLKKLGFTLFFQNHNVEVYSWVRQQYS